MKTDVAEVYEMISLLLWLQCYMYMYMLAVPQNVINLMKTHWSSGGYRTRHFGKLSQDTSAPSRGMRHFGISAEVRFGTSARLRKSRDTWDPPQWRDSTPPIIWLKLGAEMCKWFGAKVAPILWCRSVLWPKCPAPVLFVSDDHVVACMCA